jgi:hypothetical protein
MAKVIVHSKGISVKLTPMENFWSLKRDFEIPVTSIKGAEVIDGKAVTMFADLAWAIRVGTALPFVYYAGRFYRPGGKDFIVVRPGKPSLQLNLNGKPYIRVILTVENPEKLAEEINSALAAC